MKVFISWSGVRSKAVATALRSWLPDVIQGIEPWMSELDIEAGARWGRRVDQQLNESRFGIICLTESNQTAPWILFEAGALAKTIDDSFVCPYLIDLKQSGIKQGPLTQFQCKQADEAGTLDLIRAINRAATENKLPDDKLDRAFPRWWPDLRAQLSSLPSESDAAVPRRSVEDVLDEVLVAVRFLQRGAEGEVARLWEERRSKVARVLEEEMKRLKAELEASRQNRIEEMEAEFEASRQREIEEFRRLLMADGGTPESDSEAEPDREE